MDHGASVSAVNNDGELAIDISESDEMEELLQKEIDNQVSYRYLIIRNAVCLNNSLKYKYEMNITMPLFYLGGELR